MWNKLIILTVALTYSGISMAQKDVFNTDSEEKISIYPNPTVDFLMIRMEGDISNVAFELSSMIGNKLFIKPEEVGFGKYKISVKGFASGYYFLIVTDEEKQFTKAFKFLKN